MALHWDIETIAQSVSTQDDCKMHAENGAHEGFGIQALNQTGGRGRHGRSWISEDGALTFSFILRPGCDVRFIGQISILIGVALRQAVQNFDSRDVTLKWPNDVLVNGQKCAGILMDSGLDGQNVTWVTIGIGVNIGSAPDIGASIDGPRDVFLKMLLEHVEALYSSWREQGFEDIRQQWIQGSYERGTMLNVGAFEDLDDFGNLIVRDTSNVFKTISAGDVYLKDLDYAAGH